MGTFTPIGTLLRSLSRPQRLTLGHQRSPCPWTSLWRQPVSMALRMPWPVFFLAMTCLYLAEVAIFALAFQLDGRHLEGEGAMGLPSSVVFSLQNLFSASFQSARVTSIYTLALAALQRIAGLLTNAMVTGCSSCASPRWMPRFGSAATSASVSRPVAISVAGS